MATANFEGTNFALQDTPVIATLIHSRLGGAEIYCSSDECFASGTDLDSGSFMSVGKLPKGAVVIFAVIWPINSSSVPTVMSNAVTGELGISGDPDLFGSFTTLATVTPQYVVPEPDGSTFTTSLDMALEENVDVLLKTGGAALTAGEGIAVKILYTIA